jgi:hypothetical protein
MFGLFHENAVEQQPALWPRRRRLEFRVYAVWTA